MDESLMRMIARWAENGRRDADVMRERIFGGERWDMDLGKLSKLIRTKTTADLYGIAEIEGPEKAAAHAMSYIRDVLGGHGSPDLHDQATRMAQANAAMEVLRTLPAAGITSEHIGDLFLGNRLR